MDWGSFVMGYITANALLILFTYVAFWIRFIRYLDSPVPGRKL